MLEHDLSVALRRVASQRFSTAIGVAVLALGLVCFVVANLFVSYVRNYDQQWPNADRIRVVAERLRADDFGVTPAFDTGTDAPIAELVRVDVPELSAVARLYLSQQVASIDDRRVPAPVAFVEPEFAEIFPFDALAGDARAALAMPRSAVVTRRAAERLFGTVDAVGRSLTLMTLQQPVDVAIGAVVADLPTQSHLSFGSLFANGAELFVSWDVAETFAPLPWRNWGTRLVKTYLLLPGDGSLSVAELDRRLAGIAAERVPEDWRFLNPALESRPVSAIAGLAAQNWFQGNWGGTVWVDVLSTLRAVAAAILAVACLNFLNLAMVQATGRALDVSTRKVLGATTRDIVRQDLVYTGLVVALAVALALAIVMPLAKLLTAPWSLSLEIPWGDPWFVAFLGGTVCGVTVAAGLYPALVAARARRSAGASINSARDALAVVRTFLVGLQFAVASSLVVGAIVLLLQRNELHHALVGRLPDEYVGIFLPQPGLAGDEVLVSELERGPGIIGTAAVTPPPFMGAPRRFSRSRDGAGVLVDFNLTSDAYFDVMGVPVVAGRAFVRERADDVLPRTADEWAARRGRPPAIVLDRAAARALGWPNPAAALGELVYAPGGAPHEIVGIVEPSPDAIRAGGTTGAAFVFSPLSTNFRIVRIASGAVDEALAHIDATMRSMAPGQPVSRVFFDQIFDGYYQSFDFTNRVLTGLAAFALLISAIGLFGISGYVAKRRTREVAIRKCQGATPVSILRLLLWDFSKPVVWANLAAWPLVLIALDRYLDLFAERVMITPLPFAAALVGTWLLACFAVAGYAWRAARIHPAEALRN